MIFTRRKRYPQSIHVQYAQGPIFTNGAQELVFEPLTGLPMYFYNGPGRLAGALRVEQQPQVYVNGGFSVAGIPQQAGQLFLQPLIDPNAQGS